MKKTFFTVIAAIAAISCVTGYFVRNKQSNANALTLANVEALTNVEPTLGYHIDVWEEEYRDRYENGGWIWIVEGGRDCYRDAGDEPDCLQSYYRYEERR